MSSTDNWIKFYRWWQEHLKSHFVSSSIITDERRRSLVSYYSTKNSQLIKIKKRASCGGIDEYHASHNDFRHVRDSIRGKNLHITRTMNNKRLVLQKLLMRLERIYVFRNKIILFIYI